VDKGTISTERQRLKHKKNSKQPQTDTKGREGGRKSWSNGAKTKNKRGSGNEFSRRKKHEREQEKKNPNKGSDDFRIGKGMPGRKWKRGHREDGHEGRKKEGG